MDWFNKLKDYAQTIHGNQYINEAVDTYGSQTGVNVNNEADAYRHLLWTAEMARKTNPTISQMVSDYHENVKLPLGILGAAHPLQTEEEKKMDLYNNAIGINIGEQSQSYEDTVRLAKEAIEKNRAMVINEPMMTYTSYAKQKGLLDNFKKGTR
jgi:hypothetical protein|tara:strand:- start:188 stop:649 length:462 start_codon:yes stop_codon:yes gene_type:complete